MEPQLCEHINLTRDMEAYMMSVLCRCKSH